MNTSILATVFRWTARLLGCALLALVVLIAVGEGMPNPWTQPLLIQVGFLAMAVLMGGMVAAWRWELTGAAISLTGWCLFVGAVVPLARMNWFVAALAVPGLLYAGSAILRRHRSRIPAQK